MVDSRKTVLVTFAPAQWKLVAPYVGTVGIGQAETVRNIVINWVLSHPSVPGVDQQSDSRTSHREGR